MPESSLPKQTDAAPSQTLPRAEPGLPPPENKRFYPALDGLRAVAVLMVFWQHYYAEKYPSLNWGWAGVDVFFVLSGFLITGILYDTQDTAHRVRNFYMRRTLRIFPLYYGVLIAALLTTPIFHWFWNRAWVLWFLYLGNYARFLLLHTPLMQMGAPIGVIEHLRAQPIAPTSVTLLLGHFWSLCVEEQFYLVWPMVVFTVRKRTTLRTICVCSVPLVLAARIVCVYFVPKAYLAQELLYRTTPFRLDALLLGGLAALMLRGPESARLVRGARPLLAVAVAGFLGWELLYRRMVGSFYHPYAGAPVLTTVGYTLLDLGSVLLILSILSLDHPLARLLTLKPLRRLGEISYGFYVFHDMFRLVLMHAVDRYMGRTRFPHDRLTYAVVGFSVSLLLAMVSFHLYEKPFLRLKSRFTPSPRAT